MFELLKKQSPPWEGRPTILDAVAAWDGRADLPDDGKAGNLRFSVGPVTRNRNFAARVLKATPRAEWGQEVMKTLARAAAEEPNPDLRDELKALLARR